MSSTDTTLFWSVFLIVFFINMFAPLIATGFSEYDGVDTGTSFSTDDSVVDTIEAPSLSDYFAIGGLSLLLVPFWTLGVPAYVNIFIMIPLRVLGWILVLRMIRGN